MTKIEQRLGYEFRDRGLLETALRHRSSGRDGAEGSSAVAAAIDNLKNNERLEFLGDAVLGLLVSEGLLNRFPESSEGRLTKIKARLVSSEGLFEVAAELDLGAAVELSATEERNGGRLKRSILADAVEALIAAIYLDGGAAAAAEVVGKLFLTPERVSGAADNLAVDNAKSTLQELLQARQQPPPEYRVLAEDGPPHARTFHVEVVVGDLVRLTGEGRTKKEAEQRAARKALREILPGIG